MYGDNWIRKRTSQHIARFAPDVAIRAPLKSRRPPQSNCPPDTVRCPDNGSTLEFQITKGGIPRMAPQRLTSLLQSLPPILYIMLQNPISSCSKGSRGLSVLLRVAGVFTGITISPSPSLRQRPSRYAIRAGRNLPDKEFRSNLLLPSLRLFNFLVKSRLILVNSRKSRRWWVGHFCQPPHVAMGYGLYLHLTFRCLAYSL